MAQRDRIPGFLSLLSFDEAAQLLGVPAQTVVRLVMEHGELSAVRFTPSGMQIEFDPDYIKGVDDRVTDRGEIVATVPDGAIPGKGWHERVVGVLRIERSEVERFVAAGAVPDDRSGAPARDLSLRERETLLTIIGALLDLVRTPRPGRDSDAAVIRELIDNYGDKSGIAKSTLEAKFAEARRRLTG